MTITVDEDTLRWARRQAAEEETSVARFIGKVLAERRSQSDVYWQAYKESRTLPLLDIDASQPLGRNEAHRRR